MYENIDMKKTGLLLKKTIGNAGYTVKDIQKILHLSCPQPIYRWFKGTILPSVNHLYVLSRLLKIHMEDLLVVSQEHSCLSEANIDCIPMEKRLHAYWKHLRVKKCAQNLMRYRFISKKNAVSKSSQKLHSPHFALKIPPQTSIILIYLIKNSTPQPITNTR